LGSEERDSRIVCVCPAGYKNVMTKQILIAATDYTKVSFFNKKFYMLVIINMI